MNFDPSSRLWVYLSNRPFTDVEVSDINLALKHFCKEWTAHGSNLKAFGEVADPWVLAAWFHYPNGWIVSSDGVPVAPKEAIVPDSAPAALRLPIVEVR